LSKLIIEIEGEETMLKGIQAGIKSQLTAAVEAKYIVNVSTMIKP